MKIFIKIDFFKNNCFQFELLGIIVTTSLTCNIYRIVVFPAPSKPRISILRSLLPKNLENMLKNPPNRVDINRLKLKLFQNYQLTHLI
jgi:hypothetical protein